MMGVVEAMVGAVGINKIKGGKNPFTLDQAFIKQLHVV